MSGYAWVFLADLFAGGLTGMLAAHWRRRGRDEAARGSSLGGLVLGAVGGALVFLPFFLLSTLMTDADPLPTALLLALTLGVILVTGGSVALSRRRH